MSGMDMQSPGPSDGGGPSQVHPFASPPHQPMSQQQQGGHPQQPPIQQQQQQPVRDVVLLFNERLRIILEPNGDLQRKIKTFEEIRDLADELYLKEQLSMLAGASVQTLQSIFQSFNPAFYDDLDTYKIRKLALDQVVRFVPVDQYKSSSKIFEDLFYRQIPIENELNAVYMIKYVVDLIKNQKVQHRQGLFQLVYELRVGAENLLSDINVKIDAFARPAFNLEFADNEDYRNKFLNNLHFDTPIKQKRVYVYPRAKNSIKVLSEFAALVNPVVFIFKEEIYDEIPNLIRVFTGFLNLSLPKTNVEPEYGYLFQEVQMKILNFIYMVLKPTQNAGSPMVHLINPYRKDIANGARKLLRSLGASAINIRKELILTIKTLFTTELRIDLLDLIPDFCFEEIVCGPPTVITPSLRSDLFMTKADAFHNVRQSLDWNVFQHLMLIIVRDFMDYTLTPPLQGVFGKLVLNYIDACQRAEDGRFTHLAINYSYDSARVIYENLFFALTHKINVLTQECVRPLLKIANKSERAPKTNEFYDSDEEDNNGQEWMDEENPETMMDRIDEPIDEFEREDTLDPEQERSFVSVAVEEFTKRKLDETKKKFDEIFKENNNFSETNSKREIDGKKIEASFGRKQTQYSKRSMKTNDSRLQMLWLNRPLARHLPILPLIKSHSEISQEKCNTFIPPEPFPFAIQDLRKIFNNYASALRQLFVCIHFDDELKSQQPPIAYLTALNTLFRNFIDIYELCNFTPSPNPPFITPHNQAPNLPEDKELMDYMFFILATIHPSVYERILRHHLPYFMHRTTISTSIQHLLLQLTQYPQLQILTNTILLDYCYDNIDILFVYDDDDKHRVDFLSRLLRIILSIVMQILRSEPLMPNYIQKIQAFFVKIISKTVYYGTRMYDASHLHATLKQILRICGTPAAEHFYRLFLPLFPSFLHWFSSLQNILSPDTLQEYFIELCLSLPARLSSLVPYMPLLVDPEINSFQNSSLLSQQGLRTIELCLDNYSSSNVKDFFGPLGIPRLMENLWNLATTTSDHSLALQTLKIIGKLSSVNRNALCDIQKLNFTPNPPTYDSPVIVLNFERSGKTTDNLISEQLNFFSKVSPEQEANIKFIEEARSRLYNFEEHQVETKPISCNLLLRPVLSQCVNILKNCFLTERNFLNQNRCDAAWILLTWIRSGFDNYGIEFEKDEFVSNLLITNQKFIESYEEKLNTLNVSFALWKPYKCTSTRQMYIDCIIGLSYAAANGDVKDDIENHWEELIDFLTLQLHIETSITYFNGIHNPSTIYPSSLDAYILIDAIITILCEPWSRFHACAIYTFFRMIQTSLSFASTPEKALNVPLFHFLCHELSQLCTHAEPSHRLGGISLLEIMIENLPSNFLFAAFDSILSSALDVLHFGDDDVSQTTIEAAINVGKKLIDKIIGCEQGKNSKKLYHYLASVVLKHSKSSSFGTNTLLCEILTYLRYQNTVPSQDLFSAEQVHDMFKDHEIGFLSWKMEYRYVQLNFLVHFLHCCSSHSIKFSKNTSKYLQILASCYVLSDEAIANGPDHETVPPHPPNGTNLVPFSPLVKFYSGAFFIQRLKEFRNIVAGSITTICSNFFQSEKMTSIEMKTKNDLTKNVLNAKEAAEFLLGVHVNTIINYTDCRIDLSVTALSKLGSLMTFKNKDAIISNIVAAIIKDSVNIHLYKALNALIKNENSPILHQHISSSITQNDDDQQQQYFSLFQNLCKFETPNAKMNEYLLAFLNICQKIGYYNNDLFDEIFSMLSNKRILSMFELGEVDLFSSCVIFFGSKQECAIKVHNFFLSPINLKDEHKRKAYLTLITHPDGRSFLTSLIHYENILITLLKTKTVKVDDGNIEQAVEIQPYILDEFVIKIFTQFATSFPNRFARNKKLAEFLRQFLLSDYFRGNYLLQDFGVDKNDRIRLTSFHPSLANVPDLITNLLINYFIHNPKKYEILLALCTMLPQMTFADNGALKRFISNFIVNRTTLLWRRQLLKFAMNKFNLLFKEQEELDEDSSNRYNDCQVYLGNFFLYVVFPCFSYSLERFRARQVFNCEHDKFIGKRRWTKRRLHSNTKESTDLVDIFCETVLSRFQTIALKSPSPLRPELSHGVLQFAILLIQRASSHIHPPGSKKQSKHLQVMMQTAWGSLVQSGIYSDRWLRSVAYFLLANIMNAVYIKRDIVYQVFDCLISLPDIRENPIAQKALDGIATHSARRRDECYQGLVEKIKDALYCDGFNPIKVANILFMLANNYEAFFPARGILLPSIVFVMLRAQHARNNNIFNYIFDGLETIVGWEDMKNKKFNLFKDNLTRTLNQQDPIQNRRYHTQLSNFTRNANFLAMDRVLSDAISLLMCKILPQPQDDERRKRFLSIFNRAIHPKLLCRPICAKLERLLSPREAAQNHPQYATVISTMTNTIKVLTQIFSNASSEAVHQCALYLQGPLSTCFKTQNVAVIQSVVSLIAKMFESAKDLPMTERKFSQLFVTLNQYFNFIGENFIIKNDWNEITFMVTSLKTICTVNDTALNLFAGPNLIRVIAAMAKNYRNIQPMQNPSEYSLIEKHQLELLVTVMEIYMERAALVSSETMMVYLSNVISPLVKTTDGLNSKILDIICRTLEEATKPPHLARTTHFSIVGALTRYHIQAVMKSTIAINSLFSTILVLAKVKSDEELAEITIPFYLGFTAPDAKIRAAFVDFFEARLPKNIFERLSYLLMVMPWQLVNIVGVVSLFVELLLRCIKVVEPGSETPMAEDEPMTDPSTIVEIPAIIKPPCSFWSSIRNPSFGKSKMNVDEIVDVDPCSQGVFHKTSVEFLPKRLKNICEDYYGALERSSDLFTKKFSDFKTAYISVIGQETELTGKIFVEIFTTLWSNMSDSEREFITELFSHFLQLPTFNASTEKLSKIFWQVIQKCNPPMNIDRTKIFGTLSGLKNIHSTIYGLEMSLSKSINLLEPSFQLRQLYRQINENDMVAETFKIYEFSKHASEAYILYNQSKYFEALEAVDKAQIEYASLIKEGEIEVDSINVGIKNDFDLVTNLGISCIKQLGQWDKAYNIAKKTSNAKLASEAIFHVLQTDDHEWNEFEKMSRNFATSEDVSDNFLSLMNHILFMAYKNEARFGTLFIEGGSIEKLGQVIAEKWRRLPSFYSPKHLEVLSELSLYTDVIDGASMCREINKCYQTHLSLIPLMDTSVKQLTVHYYHRNLSPSDSLEFAMKICKTRTIFLMFFNNQLHLNHPEVKDPSHPSFNLTPMHSINELYLKQVQQFSHYSYFDQAKKTFNTFPLAENFNAFDACTTMCTIIKTTVKQYKHHPTTLIYGNLKNELATFSKINIQSFTPDCVALLAATKGQVCAVFKEFQKAEVNYRTALKLISTTDDISGVNLATKIYKMYSTYAFERYMEIQTPGKGLAAVTALLKYLSKEVFTKAHRQILRLIFVVKRISYLENCPDLLPVFYALVPKCRMVTFLPYLHLMANEISATANEAFATILILTAQAYPLHVLHAIYLQFGSEKFFKFIQLFGEQRSALDDRQRLVSDLGENAFSTKLNDFVQYNQNPDHSTLSKMEALNRNGFLFKLWQNRKKITDPNVMLAFIMNAIYKFVPADTLAFASILKGLEEMNNHFIENYYREWVSIWNVFMDSTKNGNKGINVSAQILKLQQDLNVFLQNMENEKQQIATFKKLKEQFPKLTNTFEENLQKISDYFIVMENVIQEAFSTIKLDKLSQELYNFSSKRGRVISLSSFLDSQTGHCIPTIDSFIPNIKIYAKNGRFIKQIDVRISNGKLTSYYIEDGSREDYFKSATNCLSSLNIPAEKFPDTNRRGALFRVANIFQLDKFRLIEITNCNLNRHHDVLLSVRPMSFILAEASHEHPFKAIANYYNNYSNAMEMDDDQSRKIRVMNQMEKSLPEKCLFNWFISHYEDDLGSVWYLRKSLAIQFALHSLMQYVFHLEHMKFENLFFDMNYGKLLNVHQSFTIASDSKNVPFRLTPALVEFFDLSINGHFMPTLVALARALLRKRFEDYFRPYYWDFWVKNLKTQGKSITATEVAEFDKHMIIFKAKLKEIAECDGTLDKPVYDLLNKSQEIQNRSDLSPDLFPWF